MSSQQIRNCNYNVMQRLANITAATINLNDSFIYETKNNANRSMVIFQEQRIKKLLKMCRYYILVYYTSLHQAYSFLQLSKFALVSEVTSEPRLQAVLEEGRAGWDGIPLIPFGVRTLQARVPPTNNWVFPQFRCLFIPVTQQPFAFYLSIVQIYSDFVQMRCEGFGGRGLTPADPRPGIGKGPITSNLSLLTLVTSFIYF